MTHVSINSRQRLGALGLVAAFAISACGGGGSTTSPSAPEESTAPAESSAPAESPAAGGGGEVTGSVNISGSSTVQPISDAIAQGFKTVNPGFDYTVEGPGTGDGFQRFCAGEIDIADASRAISDEEVALCQGAGIEYTELKVALDGISIVTSANDTQVECLSFADLYALTGPESTGFNTWAAGQEIATALGSNTQLPDVPLAITGPGEESGTFDFYVETVIEPIGEERGLPEDQWTTRPDYTASANDNAIVDGVAGSDTSLGWVGFAFLEENLDKIKPINVAAEANGTCVEPTHDTIADGTYPIARDLFIYVNNAKIAENPALAPFVDYYLADGTITGVLETVPYVELSPEAFAESKAAWEAAKGS
jgi:phosphate transport system substrate-binding protein